jgi:transcriptional regulator with XRE-family HTH domain
LNGTVTGEDPWKAQLRSLGEFIRSQRHLARLSLRDLSDLTQVSNAYLSQIERGLHEPSVRVIRSIAEALQVSAETLLHQAGLVAEDDKGSAAPPTTEAAIRADARLTDSQKTALLGVYRSYLAANE